MRPVRTTYVSPGQSEAAPWVAENKINPFVSYLETPSALNDTLVIYFTINSRTVMLTKINLPSITK